VDFSLARYGEADLAVYDLLGREIVRQVFVLESGTHSFNVSLPSGMYILSLQTTDGKSAARLLSEGKGGATTPLFLRKQESPANNKGIAGQARNDASLEREQFPSFGGVRGGVFSALGEVKANNTNFSCNYGDTLILQCFITESELFVEEQICYFNKKRFA
jgi:hypothetical protein